MPLSLRRPQVALILLALLATLAVWGARSTSGASPAATAAVPVSEAVGSVKLSGLPGETTLTTTIRSFSIAGSNSGSLSSGGGTGTGAFTPGIPSVGLDSALLAPQVLRATAFGVHLPSVVVSLYRPDSTVVMERWTFTEVMMKEFRDSQTGPKSRAPRLTLSWTYRKVRYDTMQANGTSVYAGFCYDATTHGTC